jgi:hypothetical protein
VLRIRQHTVRNGESQPEKLRGFKIAEATVKKSLAGQKLQIISIAKAFCLSRK